MQWLTLQELQTLTGFAQPRIRTQLTAARVEAQAGTMTGRRSNLHVYNSTEALPALYGQEGINPELEKAMLDRARRFSVEMDNEYKKGERIDLDESAQLVAEILGIVKARILGLSTRLAPMVVVIGDIREADQLIRGECIRVLSEAVADLVEESGYSIAELGLKPEDVTGN